MLYLTNDKQFIELIESIQCAAKLLLCRVNDLLDSSTLEKGTFTKNVKVFDLIKSVQEIISINSPQASYRDIELKVKQLNELPKYISSDNTRLQ